MSDIILKYSLLNKTAQQEVNDFPDFLLSKQKRIKEKSPTDYQTKIMSVSTWTDEDLKQLENNRSSFNHWNIDEW